LKIIIKILIKILNNKSGNVVIMMKHRIFIWKILNNNKNLKKKLSKVIKMKVKYFKRKTQKYKWSLIIKNRGFKINKERNSWFFLNSIIQQKKISLKLKWYICKNW
jgi:hypothetical protein